MTGMPQTIRIETDGTPINTRITDAVTGNYIHGVTSMQINLPNPQELATVTLTIECPHFSGCIARDTHRKVTCPYHCETVRGRIAMFLSWLWAHIEDSYPFLFRRCHA